MKNFFKKHGLTILSLAFTVGSFLVESKKAQAESEMLKTELKEEIKKELLAESVKEI